MVPMTANAPTTISTTRANVSIGSPFGRAAYPPRGGSDEAGDVVRGVEELNAATQAQLADIRVPSGDHSKARTAARAAVRTPRRPVCVENSAPGPPCWRRFSHLPDNPSQHP